MPNPPLFFAVKNSCLQEQIRYPLLNIHLQRQVTPRSFLFSRAANTTVRLEKCERVTRPYKSNKKLKKSRPAGRLRVRPRPPRMTRSTSSALPRMLECFPEVEDDELELLLDELDKEATCAVDPASRGRPGPPATTPTQARAPRRPPARPPQAAGRLSR